MQCNILTPFLLTHIQSCILNVGLLIYPIPQLDKQFILRTEVALPSTTVTMTSFLNLMTHSTSILMFSCCNILSDELENFKIHSGISITPGHATSHEKICNDLWLQSQRPWESWALAPLHSPEQAQILTMSITHHFLCVTKLCK